eukprot:scaffold5890_cov110-Isochrysis_galbana.AAC.8
MIGHAPEETVKGRREKRGNASPPGDSTVSRRIRPLALLILIFNFIFWYICICICICGLDSSSPPPVRVRGGRGTSGRGGWTDWARAGVERRERVSLTEPAASAAARERGRAGRERKKRGSRAAALLGAPVRAP